LKRSRLNSQTLGTPLLILLATLAMAQPPTAGPLANLVGRWRSVETSKGGIGAVYQFNSDGTLDFSPGAIVDMPYRVEGDQLILPPATTTGPEMKSTLTWPTNNVLRISTKGQSEEYQRQGTADPRDRLLGEWLTWREMDGQRMPTEMFFYPAGKALLVIRFTTQQGRYSVTNGRLVGEFGGRVGLDGPFDFANGVLTIHRSGGRVTKLARY
jgi:hypothetical protein